MLIYLIIGFKILNVISFQNVLEFNWIENDNDIGWHNADNIFVFDEEPYEDGSISLTYLMHLLMI